MKIRNSFHLMLSLLLLCLFLKAHLSFAADTITANQSLSGDQTLVSKGGNFVLGFFKPGNLSNYYIGIWYKKVSKQTVVWVANRETPVSDQYSSHLTIQDGNLVLLNESRTPIWSTNISSTSASSWMGILLDDGNFKLIDGLSNINSTPPIWQSLDNPTHTWLPGGKLSYNKITKTKQLLTSWKNSEDPAPGLFSFELVPNQKENIIRWNQTKQYWTSGEWNGLIFSKVPEMRYNYLYNFSYVDNENESYFTYSVYNAAIISRLVIDLSGQIKQLTWLDTAKEWSMFWAQPRQQCEVYAYCGAFGTCNQNSLPFCNCLPGFNRNFTSWDDFSGGCVRETKLECENNSSTKGQRDRFWTLNQMSLPEDSQDVAVGSAALCESACLSNCSCTAYAYENNGCSIWNKELLNLHQLSAEDGNGRTLYLRLTASGFSRHTEAVQKQSKHATTVIVSITVGAAVLLAASISCFFFTRRILVKRKESEENILGNLDDRGKRDQNLVVEDDEVIDVPFVSLESILAATANFSDANKLGRGGFGPVYKGIFAGGKEIAVKRLSCHSEQGIVEFKNEVVLIAKLQHRNLVRLLGYCIKGSEKLLLYEYMPNKSLDSFIFDQGRCTLLDWKKRFDIILGIARGLLYLHQDSRLRVIHRDLKASNILLDEELNPKISDFGLARIVAAKETEANTQKIVGTYGYMSPEYALEGLFSVKSDVFSFGVILLEIISGKRNIGFYEEVLSLLGYAWKLWQERRPMEFVDKKLLESCNNSTSEVLKCMNIGLLCVQEDPLDRPTMANVLLMLRSETATLPSPNQPAFVARRRPDSSVSGSSSSKPDLNSINELTVSAVEGR